MRKRPSAHTVNLRLAQAKAETWLRAAEIAEKEHNPNCEAVTGGETCDCLAGRIGATLRLYHAAAQAETKEEKP